MKRPAVGIAIFIHKDGKFVMNKRIGSHASGKWSVPGGHLEFGESLEECAKRETLEETGMNIKNVKFLALTNDVLAEDDKHYISIWMTADWASGDCKITEPDKCTEQMWADFQSLPEPLFEPCWQNLRKVKPDLFV